MLGCKGTDHCRAGEGLLCSVADPDPGFGAFLTPGSGMGKKFRNRDDNPDHISESLETIFWVKILKFFDADPGPRNPGWKKSDPGCKNLEPG
jgi:hypothetical protein